MEYTKQFYLSARNSDSNECKDLLSKGVDITWKDDVSAYLLQSTRIKILDTVNLVHTNDHSK